MAIPAIFLAVGPPAGGMLLFVLSAVVLFGLFPPIEGLPLLLVASYVFGGVQALLTGLAAAATVRPGEGVRALPPVLASLVLGLTVAATAAVADDGGERAGRFVNAGTLVAVHLAGAFAGVAACRWIERRRARRATSG